MKSPARPAAPRQWPVLASAPCDHCPRVPRLPRALFCHLKGPAVQTLTEAVTVRPWQGPLLLATTAFTMAAGGRSQMTVVTWGRLLKRAF